MLGILMDTVKFIISKQNVRVETMWWTLVVHEDLLCARIIRKLDVLLGNIKHTAFIIKTWNDTQYT